MIAQLSRFAVFLAGAAGAVIVAMVRSDVVGFGIAFVIVVVAQVAAQWVWNRLATREQIVADLKDWVHNPPS